MKRILSRMMVTFMTTMATTGSFAAPIDWSNFNSTLIIEVTRPTGVFTSSGVAISKDTILTAAHCLDGEVLKVRVSNQAAYDPKGKFYAVESFEIHPDYNVKKSNYKSDLAKIKLQKYLPENTMFYPIIKKDENLIGKILRLGFGGRNNQNVRTLITPEFKSVSISDETLELNDMYSFSGDSGGPIFIQQGAQMYLIAIHSTLSYGPNGRYSYNPLLSSQRKWIEND